MLCLAMAMLKCAGSCTSTTAHLWLSVPYQQGEVASVASIESVCRTLLTAHLSLITCSASSDILNLVLLLHRLLLQRSRSYFDSADWFLHPTDSLPGPAAYESKAVLPMKMSCSEPTTVCPTRMANM